MSTPRPLPERDLAEIATLAEDDLRELEGARIFVTGGTGFVGTWLVEALLAADRELDLRLGLTLLTRDQTTYRRRRPHLAGDESVTLMEGDVRTFTADGHHDFVVHAAASTSTARTPAERTAIYSSIVHGMERVIEVASSWGRPRLLFTSSGAVYGTQPPDLMLIPENHLEGPDPLDTAMSYHGAKRAAELRSALATESGAVDVVVARLFAFVGPLLPIDQHFAVGNFVKDALAGGPIQIEGDGTPCRSYQYVGDLVRWMLRLLVSGEPGRAYNVGSSNAISIGDLAQVVADVAGGGLEVRIACEPDPDRRASRYVPDTSLAKEELDLVNVVGLAESIRRTLDWNTSG